jgi:mannose-6-phosphate isomerase-like protein (cupin superfamily)
MLAELNERIPSWEQHAESSMLESVLSERLLFRRADLSVVDKERFLSALVEEGSAGAAVERTSGRARVWIGGDRAVVTVTVTTGPERSPRRFENVRFFTRDATSWKLDSWLNRPLSAWPDDDPRAWAEVAPESWSAARAGAMPDYAAPDESAIFLLLELPDGVASAAECELPAGTASQPVRHRAVREIWHVVSGRGALWREALGEVNLEPGVCAVIPPRAAFQFRADPGAPLRVFIVTIPRWPGADEAVPAIGPWTTEGR